MISRLLLALALALALAAAGCNESSGPDTGPAPSGTASNSESSPEPTEATDPTATPATGHLVDRDVFSYRLPADVEWDLDNDDTIALHRDDEGDKFVISVIDTTKQAGSPSTLDYAAELSLSNTVMYDPPLERGEDRTVNGVEGWTAQTVDKAFGELVYRFGTVHEDRYVDLTFSGPEKDPRTREWIEAVLASVAWE